LTDSLGFLLNRVAGAMRINFERHLAPYGVTAQQWLVLRLVRDLANPRPSEMAEVLSIDRGAVTRLIDRLVDKGLVERCGDPTDLRAARVELTVRGQKLAPVIAGIAEKNNEAVLALLEPHEGTALVAHLKRVLDQLKPMD